MEPGVPQGLPSQTSPLFSVFISDERLEGFIDTKLCGAVDSVKGDEAL